MSILKDLDISGGLLATLGSIVLGLLTLLAALVGLRGVSKVRNGNAEDGRQSRYEENRDKNFEAVVQRMDMLSQKLVDTQQSLLDERAKNSQLRHRLRDHSIAMSNVLERLEAANPAAVREIQQIQRWSRDSTYAAFDDRPPPPEPGSR